MQARAAQRLLSYEECLLSAPCCDLDDSHRQTGSHSPKASSSRLAAHSSGPAHGVAVGPLAFCCEEPECLPGLGVGGLGEACDGGPACPSASFVGWDIPVNECEECTSSPGFIGGSDHGMPHRLPYDSFNECCDEACFTLPDLALGVRRSPPQLDCPDCWGEPSGSSGSSGMPVDDETMTESESSVATPGDSVSPAQGGGGSKHSTLMGMDDRVIQEILECCCNEQDHPHQHHGTSESFHPFHAHQLPHSPTDPLTSNDFNPFSSLPTILAFPCKWSECNLSFASKDLLATHVNGDHLAPNLAPPLPPIGEPFNLSAGLPDGSTAFARCLWDECASGGPSAALDLGPPYAMTAPWMSEDRPVVSPQVQDATSLLLKHLLEEHLAKLEPGLALAWSSSLLPKTLSHHPAASSSLLSPFPPTPQSQGSTTPLDPVLLPPLPDLSTPSLHPHPHAPHQHTHPHLHAHAQPGKVVRHAHDSHRHHGHPYGVHPRVATAVAPPPQPSSTGSHLCRWRSCDLSFETSAELMNHLSVEHVGSGKAGYICEWEGCDRCDESKGFAQRQKVMRHLQTHTGDRPFVCEVCSKSFSEATTLTQHIRIHTQEKPYKCTQPGCEKAFALASALTIHLRTHSGSKPFLCPFPGCTSAFSESSNLSKHVRTHKGEKGYPCEECGKAFSRSDQLARHKKIHAKQRAEG